ncbi:MAG: hypothetical protein ABSB22_04455 [Thermodesulfobacteriota bacterium]|jgi:hypothetical protein
MTEQQWHEYLKRSRGWAIRMAFDLLHSEAYRELDYGPALKVLSWFHEKIKLEAIKGKRGKNRFQPANNGKMEFTYREALYRGLTSQKFSKALRELHRLGFIDVPKPGSALKGDFTEFSFSERWKTYDPDDVKKIEFPKSVHWVNFGFGGQKEKT